MPIKTLLVDDERSLLDQAEIFLERIDEDIEIHTAISADKALEMMDKNDFDVIVSDYQMPDKDGLEFLEEIREGRDSDIPFIMFTGKGREEVAMRALNLGVDMYLQKGEDPSSQSGVLAQAITQEVEHYRTERERELTRKEWQKIFDALPEIATLISSDHEFLRINEKGAQALGMEKEEIIGKKCYEIVHNRDSPIRACPCERVLETGEADMGEEFEENGRHYIAGASPILDENGEVEAFIHTVKDITERIRAEEEKREVLKDKERIMDTVPEIIYQLDEEGRIVEWNDELVELSGYPPQELEGKHALDFFPDEESEKISDAIETAFQEGFVRVEANFLTRSGEKILHSFIATAIKDEDGKPIGLTGVGRDITERKKAEERKDFLNTLLRQDLRSKYQTIQGFLQLIEKEDLSEEHKEYLRKAISAGSEADEILDLAKELEEIEEVEWTGEKDIVKVLRHVTDDISSLVKREGIQIEKNYPEKISKVKGDNSLITLFSQILLTRIQRSNCDNIRIDVEEREENILLSIKDDGKQLSEDIKKLFSGEVYTGETTGLGGVRYYILREIAEHNDGGIEIKDSDMGGARFDLALKRL